MSTNEQIYWIIEDINFELILKYLNSSGWETSIDDLKTTAMAMLNEISTWEENDYGYCLHIRGNFHARREIIDGIMCLSLSFVITSWDMDYDCVTSNNYSGDIKYKGPIND